MVGKHTIHLKSMHVRAWSCHKIGQHSSDGNPASLFNLKLIKLTKLLVLLIRTKQ